MARVRQFANDLGISKNQAQTLINKGRSRKDGGSQILESVMKPKKYKAGGSNKTPTPKTLRQALNEKAVKMGLDKSDKNRSKFLNENKELVRRDLKEHLNEIEKRIAPKKKSKSGAKTGKPRQFGGGGPAPVSTDKKIKRKITKKFAGGGSNSFPDLTGDGKVTQKDILKGRGVPGFSRGGGMAIQGLGFKGVR